MLAITLQQVLHVTGLPDQTLRHWRTTLPPLKGRNGYTACFSPSDALALLVLKQLVRDMGIAVAALKDVSVQLFAVCRSAAWRHLSDRVLAVDMLRGDVSFWDSADGVDAPLVLLPMRPLADQLQAAWAEDGPSLEQLSLIPPTLVTTTARSAAQ